MGRGALSVFVGNEQRHEFLETAFVYLIPFIDWAEWKPKHLENKSLTPNGQRWWAASKHARKGALPGVPPSGRRKALGPGAGCRPPASQTSPFPPPSWPELASGRGSRGGAVPGRAAQLPRCPPSPRLPDLILKLDPRAPGLAVARSPWSPSRGPEGSPPSQADAASAARGPGGWQGAGGGRNQWQAEA